ncbi:MAG TPA: potassium-transporting ATPase subunit KdpA [Ferruginibacter sp.]|nr:potassium-transporting ATPase subunit KdpA [Ferruginibacter sp.]
MNTEIIGIIIMFVAMVLFAIPLGKYMGKVYEGERTWLDPVLNPLDKIFYKLGGIKPEKQMTWKESLVAMLLINFVWFILAMLILMNQSWLPLNPDGNPSMTADLAFNTAMSFISNTNIQHYSGESAVSYLGQLTLQFFQFVSAGTGMAVCVIVFVAMKEKTTDKLGNFYVYLIKSCTRILLPLSIIAAIFLAFSGTPMTFEGKGQFVSLQGDTVNVSRGPSAAMIAIKQIGTNGGGFYGVNSAHPFENPSYLTAGLEVIYIILIPIALLFTMGYILKRKRLAWTFFIIMAIGFLLFAIPAVHYEMKGNPAIAQMGIAQPRGSMEGKEIRFGSALSAYWGISATVTSNGSVCAMHDSFTPLAGMLCMWGMMVNCFFGGVGVGFLNFYIFVIIAVFIGGLMVGRTPEFLGKKLEAKETKIATIIALLHIFLALGGTALACHLYVGDPQTYSGWLNNPGYHGFSEMLYEYFSASANNGSEFAGLGANVPFWNISDGIIMVIGRYLPIIGPLAIAGIMANKKYVPESAGTLKTDTSTFGILVLAVIFIVAALSFFPALVLGPIAEFFKMR